MLLNNCYSIVCFSSTTRDLQDALNHPGGPLLYAYKFEKIKETVE